MYQNEIGLCSVMVELSYFVSFIYIYIPRKLGVTPITIVQTYDMCE